MTTIHAIPTTYAGINFRSRLEAKWACAFDLMCLPWVYEPIDLNGWIPDFAVGRGRTLVEIKPAMRGDLSLFDTSKFGEQRVILLSADPMWEEFEYEQCGYVFTDGRADNTLCWSIRPDFPRAGFYHDNGCMPQVDGMIPVEIGMYSHQPFYSIWNKATNITQWKANR